MSSPRSGFQGRDLADSGDTTQYVLDPAASLPVVVSDTEAVYLYGLDIIAQQQADRQYYFHDGSGGVRQLLDSTGEVPTNYAYDPFGVPVVTGDASNPYRFTGEAWDEEVELLCLRARYYQPEVGRFITKRLPFPFLDELSQNEKAPPLPRELSLCRLFEPGPSADHPEDWSARDAVRSYGAYLIVTKSGPVPLPPLPPTT